MDWVMFTLRIDGALVQGDLADALAGLSHRLDVRFEALRPHQAPAWNAFLVQLATMALETAALPCAAYDAQNWRDMLVARAEHDSPGSGETAFCLIAPETQPALFQAVPPDGLSTFKTIAATPDQIDLLVTSKNHDLKSARMQDANDEDWLFALMSLQTQEGFLGRGNYGIARMNGGFASRAFIYVRVSDNLGIQFCRDLNLLLQVGRTQREPFFGGSLGLTWLLPWDGVRQLNVGELHPLCIEVCRRVRLVRKPDGSIKALIGNSQAARIATSDEFKGDTGDPWSPVTAGDGKSLSIGADGYSWRRLCKLLFGTATEKWNMPVLARPSRHDGSGHLDLVCAGIARGQGKTEGFHERVLPIPRVARAVLLAGETDQIEWASAARNHEEDAATMARAVLRFALVTAFTKGPDSTRLDAREAGAAADQILAEHFDPFVDRSFFAYLFGEEGSDALTRRLAWQIALKNQANRVLDLGLATGPKTIEREFWAEARGRSAFDGALHNKFENLRPASRDKPALEFHDE